MMLKMVDAGNPIEMVMNSGFLYLQCLKGKPVIDGPGNWEVMHTWFNTDQWSQEWKKHKGYISNTNMHKPSRSI